MSEAPTPLHPCSSLAADLAGVSHLLHLQGLQGRKESEGRLKIDVMINLPHLKTSRYSKAFRVWEPRGEFPGQRKG